MSNLPIRQFFQENNNQNCPSARNWVEAFPVFSENPQNGYSGKAEPQQAPYKALKI
jgi:hypothetical protein